MAYTAPNDLFTSEEAILSLASSIADEDRTNLGNGTINGALDVLADALADQNVEVPPMNSGAILALAQYVSGSGGGGGGDFTTAKVAFNLAIPEGETLADSGVDVSISHYTAQNLPIVNGEAEVWLIQGYTTYIQTILGHGMDFNTYILDTSSPITATGGVSWDDDNEYFIVTGDGTISASLELDAAPTSPALL